ncbi:MAG: IS4 family transposase [Methanobacteriota archaeon]
MSTPSSGDLNNLSTWVLKKLDREFIERKARETGYLGRKRKLDPYNLILVLLFGMSNHLKPTMEEIYRRYVDFDDNPKILSSIRNQSFRKRFNNKLVIFLKSLLEHYIDKTVRQSPAHLKGIVQDFKDILVQDSSIIRISKKLYELHPAARSRDNSAGLKIHAVYSAISHSLKKATITTERVHDAKMQEIGPEVENTLLLNDLGYYSLKVFSKIHSYGGFFVSRVKTNAVFKVITVNSGPSDFLSIVDKNCFQNIKGDEFFEKIPKRGVFDLTCSFQVGEERVNKTKMPILQEFRVICSWNPIAKKWQVYVTNLAEECFCADDIYELYRYRWVIELIFKELKGDYDLGKMLLGNEPLAYIHIYSMLIRLTLSRELYCWIVSTTRKSDKDKYTPLLWSKVFAEKASEFLSVLNQYFFGSRNVTKRWNKLERSLRHLAKSRNSHKVLALQFIEFL